MPPCSFSRFAFVASHTLDTFCWPAQALCLSSICHCITGSNPKWSGSFYNSTPLNNSNISSLKHLIPKLISLETHCNNPKSLSSQRSELSQAVFRRLLNKWPAKPWHVPPLLRWHIHPLEQQIHKSNWQQIMQLQKALDKSQPLPVRDFLHKTVVFFGKVQIHHVSKHLENTSSAGHAGCVFSRS